MMSCSKSGFDELSTEVLPRVEHELSAFLRAVQELFGPDEADQAAEDWITELNSVDWSADAAPSDWRRVTINAAIRLSERIHMKARGRDQVHIAARRKCFLKEK